MPLTATLDNRNTPHDVIDLLALEAFSAGREPVARSRELVNVRPTARLLPEQARVIRDAETADVQSRLAVGDGWTIRAVHWKQLRRAMITVTGATEELVAEQLELATAGAVDPVPALVADERVQLGFWHYAPNGPARTPRGIDATDWARLRGNYSASVTARLDALMALTPAAVTGRLLLLHGPPGTGKTTLLRALARQWQDWCQVDCVLDPERLLADSAYLLEVALGDDEDEPRWRLLILEDCDELIRSEAKMTMGQQLSRLLNLTDGLLGQGRHVLVAITTNEDLAVLHPAVVRPGRSLAQLEVGRLTPAEATAWLRAARAADAADPNGPVVPDAGVAAAVADALERAGGPAVPLPVIGPEGATLAELFALRAGLGPVAGTAPVVGTGLYL